MFLEAQDGTIHNIDDPTTIVNLKARGYSEADGPKGSGAKKAEPRKAESKTTETASK